MKPALLFAAVMLLCGISAFAQYEIPSGTIVSGEYSDRADIYGTTVPGITWRKGGVKYNHINSLLTINDGGGWLTQFNDGPFPDPFGRTGNNSDYFLYTGHNEIAGDGGIVVFDTVYFNIGAGNVMNITQNRQGELTPYGEVSGGIMVGRALIFNNGITKTNRLYPVRSAIVFANNAYYSGGLTDAQHVDGFVSEINYPDGDLPLGHGGDFTFPVGNASKVYSLRREGIFEDGEHLLTVGWVDGNPDITEDPTQRTINHTGPGFIETGIAGIIPVGFWDWHYLDATIADPSSEPLRGAGALTEDQTITVSIPALDILYSGFNASDLRLMGYDPSIDQWIKLGSTGATGLTKGSLLAGVIPAGKTITAIAIGSIQHIILPVTFTSFTVKADDCKAILEWQTGVEYNNSYFNVERSTNGSAFEVVARISAAGNSNTSQNYSFTDKTPASGINYYRITQVDFDGKYSSTEVRTIRIACNVKSPLKVYPNPARNRVDIQNAKAVAQVNIIATNGLVVMKYVPSHNEAGVITLNVQSLQNGIYLLQIINKDGTKDVIKLLKE